MDATPPKNNEAPNHQLISIIAPCRNEVNYIDNFLTIVFQQIKPDSMDIQVVIADGESDDGTREHLEIWAQREDRLLIVDNPKKTTPAGLNIAISQTIGETIIRMDVHTIYAADYVKNCVENLYKTGASCVGGAWRAATSPGRAGAIAAAFGSRFGSGGAASRRVDYTGPVDTVYLGTWRRSDLLKLGGFDETLLRTEDDELNLRIIRSGGKVWQSADIKCWYQPRSSFKALAAQIYQYGYWKVPLIRKHHAPASPRHLVPVFFVFTILSLLFFGFFYPLAWLLQGFVLFSYAAVALISAALIEKPWAKPVRWLSIAWSFVCMHFAYGFGFGHALIDLCAGRKNAGEFVTRLTR